MKGVITCGISFILASCVYLFYSAGHDIGDKVTSSLLSIISFVMIFVYDVKTPLVVLICGVLDLMRHIVLE